MLNPRIVRRTTPFTVVVLLLLLMTQAFAEPTNRAGASSHTGERSRLVVWGVESGRETRGLDAQVAEFERRNPDIKVSMLSMGAGAMNPQKLMTAIVGGVPPDLVQQDRFTIGDWASRGAFRPLDDLLAADAHSNNPLAVRQSDYVSATWAEAVYDGQTYAIPNGTDDRVLYYNKQCFRDAGLDPNKPPQTWDEMIQDAVKMTQKNPNGGYKRLGFVPGFGQGWLYLWSWQQDGEVLSADGRQCTLSNPQTAKALSAMVSWYDQLGGVDAINAASGSWASDDQDPFILGQLAMRVDGDGFMGSIARYRPDLDFGVVPVPVPAERLRHEGRFKNDPTWVTWSGGFAWAVPRGSHHVPEAWRFVQWMNSPEAALIGARAQAKYVRSKGTVFVPALSANLKANVEVTKEFAPTLPPNIRKAKELAQQLLSVTKFRPVTFVGQRLWDEQVRAVDRALRHKMTPEASLAQAQEQVQIELTAATTREHHPVLPMSAFMTAGIVLAIVAVLGLLAAYWRWKLKQGRNARAQAIAGFAFVSPWVLGFLIFTVGPVLASLVLSFCDYDVLHPARFAGVENYKSLVTVDRDFILKSMGNAVYLAMIGIPLGMVTSLSMAMLLNTDVKGQKFYRTFFYMPSIVPVVASSVLWAWILNPDVGRGLINGLWQPTITAWFHIDPPGWLSVPAWSKPALIISGLWGAGGGMILWLAGLQGIPKSLYEAASIDGAGSWSQFRHITIPMLSPYIFFNLIMGSIGALQTFETAYIMGGTVGGGTTGPDDSLLVPVVYLFNNAFQYFKMGYASALAWILFIIILGLTMGQLKMAPRWVHYETEES